MEKQIQKAGNNSLQTQIGTLNVGIDEKWERRPNLKKLSDWWRTIPVYFYHTSMGGALAHANAQRCIPDLPTVY